MILIIIMILSISVSNSVKEENRDFIDTPYAGRNEKKKKLSSLLSVDEIRETALGLDEG